jgi:conjugal transfer/entry exclusion protein
VAAERNLDQVRKDIESIRRDLRASFDGASEVTQATLERWRQVDADLERLQTQVRDGSNQAVETLDSVADRLRRLGQDGER